jgi:C4-dicarboxylate-binding protein DctP
MPLANTRRPGRLSFNQEETMKLYSLLFGAITLAFSATAYAQQPIVIKFSHVVAKDTPKGKASDFFAQRAGELTKGKVKVEVYANSDPVQGQGRDGGAAARCRADAGAVAGQVRPARARRSSRYSTCPSSSTSYAELHKITKGPVGKNLMAKLEPKGIKGLAFWDNGFKSLSANKPIKNPDDFKGKKMRIQSSKVLEDRRCARSVRCRR